MPRFTSIPRTFGPISEVPPLSPERISYIAAAARVPDALERGALIAPLESPVIPLPHQINALAHAMDGQLQSRDAPSTPVSWIRQNRPRQEPATHWFARNA